MTKTTTETNTATVNRASCAWAAVVEATGQDAKNAHRSAGGWTHWRLADGSTARAKSLHTGTFRVRW